MSSRSSDRSRRRRAQALSRAVSGLSTPARRAMLAAVDADELIAGAYTDRRGRVCPMLAVHRRGARIDVGSFPRAWDAFTGAKRPRPASTRELEILRALLQEAVSDSGPARSAAPAPSHQPAASPTRQ